MTISLLPAAAAPTVEVHGGTFIGHDINGWTVAMICAIIAAVIYETTMALLRKVPLRIPFIVLQLARIQVPKAYRSELYSSWRAELWVMLKGPKRGRLLRWFTGMKFAAELSLFGARATAKVVAQAARAAVGSEKRKHDWDLYFHPAAAIFTLAGGPGAVALAYASHVPTWITVFVMIFWAFSSGLVASSLLQQAKMKSRK